MQTKSQNLGQMTLLDLKKIPGKLKYEDELHQTTATIGLNLSQFTSSHENKQSLLE